MLLALLTLLLGIGSALPIADLHRTNAVDFEHEILPLLKQSCLACHNQSKAKADLVLETPETILKGGESGPSVVPGKPDASLLLDAAAHRQKPFMPPAENKVNAPDLNPEQLALLKLWIEQGAVGEVRGEQTISWRSLGEKVQPILALALTSDGQFAACGRGNQLFIYQLPTKRRTALLEDPSLRGSAHRDLVQALDFSPNGDLLASGSYGEVKLWRRLPRIPRTVELADAPAQTSTLRQVKGEYPSWFRSQQAERALVRATNHLSYRRAMVEKLEKERQSQVDRVRKASDAVGTAVKATTEQTNQFHTAKNEQVSAEKEFANAQARQKEAQQQADSATEELQKGKLAAKENAAMLDELIAIAGKAALATNRLASAKAEFEKAENALKSAQKKVTDIEAALKKAQIAQGAAENELSFAIAAAQKAADELIAAQNHFQLADTDRKQCELQLEVARSAVTNAAPIRVAARSCDGLLIAAANDRGWVTLYQESSGEPLDSFLCDATNLWFEGEALITLSNGRALSWELNPRWKLERTLSGFVDRVQSVRFSPDGQFLTTGGGEPSRGGEVKIWRVKDGQLLNDWKGLHSDTVFALAFSPDGRYLASGGADRFAKVTEFPSGKLVRTLEGHTHHILSLDWKADGHSLVSAGADNQLKVWDAFSGEKKKPLEGFNKEVTAAAYVAETDRILAASGDSTLRLMQENGEKIRSFEGAGAYIQAARVTGDGRLALSGGSDGILRAWEIDTGKVFVDFGSR